MRSIFKKKSLTLSNEAQTQINTNNVVVNFVSSAWDKNSHKYVLKISYNLENNPDILQELLIEYDQEKDCIRDKNKLFAF